MAKIDYVAEIRKRLGNFRFAHSLEVAKTAKALAIQYGADPEKAYLAGVLHDIMKDAKSAEHLLIFEENNIELNDIEKIAKKLWHAISGEWLVRTKLGIDDEEILNAIRYHTTGRAGMSLFEKVIFVADFISADREYFGVDDMRKWAEIGLDIAIIEGLRFTICELAQKQKPIHPDTINAFNEFALKMRMEELKNE